ncbi:alpha-2-macroglobulin-like isoform X5 [Silurus meridionalis]|nr:alpha-2-macroglobulin-like isoform X5 [Silurus meridionalis]
MYDASQRRERTNQQLICSLWEDKLATVNSANFVKAFRMFQADDEAENDVDKDEVIFTELHEVLSDDSERYFIVTFPAVIESGSEAKFCVSLLKPNETLQMDIYLIYGNQSKTLFQETIEKEFHQCSQFKMSKTGCALYILNVPNFINLNDNCLAVNITVTEEGTELSIVKSEIIALTYQIGKVEFVDLPKHFEREKVIEGSASVDPEQKYHEYKTPFFTSADTRIHLLQPATPYSPVFSELTIESSEEPFKCVAEVPITINYYIVGETTEMFSINLIYMVLSKGLIVHHGHEKVEVESFTDIRRGNISFTLSVAAEFAPAVQVVVYSVLPSEKVITANKNFEVEKCFRNQVSLQFSPSKAVPGENNTLKLSAHPGSLCGLSVVDQSVFILDSENRLNANKNNGPLKRNIRTKKKKEHDRITAVVLARTEPRRDSGSVELPVTVPDTITTWETEAFCVSAVGLGLAPPVQLTVFQPFFLELLLPYSIIRGEVFELKATVFNYLSKCIMVKVTPVASSDYIIEALSPGNSSCLCANGRKTFKWTLIPTVLGDMLGRALKNLDGLLKMPYGCGEQNIALLAPNIYILQYLENTEQLTAAIRERATGFLKSGYQRQLNYKHINGAYSTFGSGEENTWLTAFVLRTFGKAQRYIFIDPEIINSAKKWLISMQRSDGCLQLQGSLFNNQMKGGVNDGVTITAYIVASFLEFGITVQDPVVNNGLLCLKSSVDKMENTYTTALLAYTFSLAGENQIREQLLKKLDNVAAREAGRLHWSQSASDDSGALSVEISSYVLLAVLTTGNLTAADLGYANRIVSWLVKQQNPFGGFSSTQDTVVALQALALYSTKVFSSDGSSTVTVTSADGDSHNFDVNQNNKLLYQERSLQDVPGKYSIDVKGSTCVSVQFLSRYSGTLESTNMIIVDIKLLSGFTADPGETALFYNVPTPSETSTLSITTSTEGSYRKLLGENLLLKFKVTYSGTLESTNMIIVDIKLLSGFTADPGELQRNTPITYCLNMKQVLPVIKIYDYYQTSAESDRENAGIDKKNPVADGKDIVDTGMEPGADFGTEMQDVA